MDAERTLTITLTVSVGDDDTRDETELARAILTAIKHGRPYTFGATTLDGVKVSASLRPNREDETAQTA